MQYLFINLLPFYSAENVMEIEKVFLDELHVVGKCITESTGFCNSLAILPKLIEYLNDTNYPYWLYVYIKIIYYLFVFKIIWNIFPYLHLSC